jgi:membrane protein
MGAAIAYWALFSIFPLVLATVAVAGFFVDQQRVETELVEWITDNVSVTPEGRADIERLLSGALTGLGALGLFGLVGLIWSASSLMAAIRNGIDAAWGSHARRHFLRGKLLDLMLVGGFGLLFAASIALTFTIRLLSRRTVLEGAAGSFSRALWEVGAALTPVALSFVTFAAMFWILPPVRTRIRDIWIGALLASALFEITKVGLTFYFSRFADYSEVYGSLGAVISFLFFVYIAACILLLGAEVAAAWPRARAGAYDDEPEEGLREWALGQLELITAERPADPLATPGEQDRPPPERE